MTSTSIAPAPGTLALIGLGHSDCGDDGVGCLVAERVRRVAPTQVQVFIPGGDLFSLLDAWAGADLAIVVDAAASGAPVGFVHRLDGVGAILPNEVARCSTHGVGLREALALAEALGRLPNRLLLYAIEGREFAPGASPSAATLAAVDDVVLRVLADLDQAASDRKEIACTKLH